MDDFENRTLVLHAALIVPDCVNSILLSLSIYGMYRGIEIQHPLYAILFLNLLIGLLLTLLDVIAFTVIPTERFIILSNSSSSLALLFHCTCWCLTSIIRYVYIIHENWIHNLIPNPKYQCYAAFALAFATAFTLSMPLFGYSIFLGKLFVIL